MSNMPFCLHLALTDLATRNYPVKREEFIRQDSPTRLHLSHTGNLFLSLSQVKSCGVVAPVW